MNFFFHFFFCPRLNASAGDMSRWNNTGVAFNFACCRGRLHCPPSWTVTQADGPWSIYRRHLPRKCKDLRVLACEVSASLFIVVDVVDANNGAADDGMLLQYVKADGVPAEDVGVFEIPPTMRHSFDISRVGYNLQKPPHEWAITSVSRLGRWAREREEMRDLTSCQCSFIPSRLTMST